MGAEHLNAIAPALIAETGMLPADPGDHLALAVITNAYVTNQVLSVDGGTHPR